MSRDEFLRNPAIACVPSLVRNAPEGRVQYHVRDIENRRPAGIFDSESAALASLKGGQDGRFSINDHQGGWCEVVVRRGERFVRRALMDRGGPAAFLGIDRESRAARVIDGPK